MLANALLPKKQRTRVARKALKAFEETVLPVYAIREFKAGALKSWVWLHNRLAETRSYTGTLSAMSSMAMFKGRMTASVLEALAATSVRAMAPAAAMPARDRDRMTADAMRLLVKSVIFLAWRKRKAMTTQVVDSLSCYSELAPIDDGPTLRLDPERCQPRPECSLAPRLKAIGAADELRKLMAAPTPAGREKDRRDSSLRQLTKRPAEILTEAGCRNLGDAMFAFCAPAGAVILTTNIKDHRPLAAAIGKVAVTPDEAAG